MELSAAVSSLFVGSLLLLVTPHSANGQKGNTYGGCEPGWLHYKRICYLIQGGHINWDAADKKCKQLGGKLADLGDLNRKSFVYSQLHNACSDRNEEKCRKKADKGACLQDHDDMAKNCRFSCGYCTSLCENKDGGHFCKTYAKANWCNSDYKFMMKYCRLSCGCNGFTDRLWQQKDYITRRSLFRYYTDGPYCFQLDLTTSTRYDTVCTTASGAGYICEKPADNHYLPEADEFRKGCPVNSFGYEDKCYILNSHRIGWQEAEKSCGGKSGTLASLHNQEILDFVRSELLIDTDSAWIGLSKRDSFWAWENGNNAEYIPWSADFDGTDINVCVEVVANENVTEFVPAKCSLKQPSVCEIPRKGLDYSHDKDDTTPRIIFSDCSKSWEEYGEYCYQYFPEAKTWSDAQSYCAGLRGSLISIHDRYTQNILKRFDQNKPAWIGLWKQDREKRYEWSDERPFDYYFWDTGNSDDRLKAQCIQADPKTRRWSGASCDSTKGFVCQIWRGHPAHIVQANTATVTTLGSTTSTTTTQKKQPDTTQEPSTPLATNKASTTVQTSDTTPGRLATETVPTESASATAEPNPTTTEPKPRSTTPDSKPDLTTPEPTPPALKPKPAMPDTEPLVPKVETTTEASKPIILNPVAELEPDQTDEENSKPSLQKKKNGVDKEGKSDKSKDDKGGSGTSSWPISPIQLIAILVGCTVFVLIFSILFVYASRNSRKRQRLEAAARDERTLSIKYKNGLPDDEDDQSPSSLSTGVVNPTFSPVTFVNQAMDDSMQGDNRDLNFGSSGGFDNQIYNVSTA